MSIMKETKDKLDRIAPVEFVFLGIGALNG